MDQEGYEFEAPSFCDFEAGGADGEGDSWFDAHTERSFEVEEERVSPAGSKRSLSEQQVGDEEHEQQVTLFQEPAPKVPKLNTTLITKKHQQSMHKFGKGKATAAISPQLLTTSRLKGSKFVPSEDAEVMAMKKAQKERAKNFARRIMMMRKAIAGPPAKHVERAIKVTSPIPFKFRSDSRIKGVATAEEAQQVKKCNKKPGELTTPRPFVFRSDERLQRKRHDTTGGEDGEPKPQEMKSPWVPLAKKISSFLNKTPARFRVRKQGEVFHNATEKEHRQRLSVPKPFEFRTDQRIKGSKFKPHEVEEEEEMRNMPKFHAKPVDKRVLESAGDLGVPRVPKKELTEPASFELATDRRSESIRQREARDLQVEEAKPFKARPFTASNATGHSMMEHSLAPGKVTIPESPMLCTKQRSTARPAVAPVEETFHFKARPMPISEPFQAKQHESKPQTQASFKVFQLATEERGKLHEEQLKHRLMEEAAKEEEARHFKARPLIEGHDAVLPHVEIPLTMPEPFQLESERLHQQAMQKWQSQVMHEEQENSKKRAFKARAFKKDQAIFVPQPSNKPLTEINYKELNSDLRSNKRREFDEKLSQKEADAARMKELQELEQKLLEQQEIAELRKSMTFKASKIMKGKQEFHPHPSDKPVTVPKTPKFATKTRALAKDVY